MTAKHTTGEWVAKWCKYNEGVFIVQTMHPSNRVIASFDDDGDGAGEQSIADAKLIAAAPNLLRVAELLVDWLDEDEGAHQLCDAARAAISKATS